MSRLCTYLKLDEKPGPDWNKLEKIHYDEDSSSDEEICPPLKKVIFTKLVCITYSTIFVCSHRRKKKKFILKKVKVMMITLQLLQERSEYWNYCVYCIYMLCLGFIAVTLLIINYF